ncbi:hypothetical protein [Sporolactobacillus nakayamae]|uniref:DoxX-like family protein n=1 Tax=Sporolactobacillus nakayamae TaxID=269670 RepID=A0A1I2PMW4_9BACL|nr:hypothetical protein [Sporolactobacillus nakayamae]SFG17374.1 hypothetical protein SAMN02982927_00898 [Sporolactobacillus nakayamae]
MKKPIGVNLINSFYIVGSLVLSFTSIFYDADANPINIAMRFALPSSYDRPFRVVLALATLVMLYGYMKLRKWGFWAMISYSFLFGSISLTLSLVHHQQPFIGNILWSLIVLLYTIRVKVCFENKASVI